MLNLSRKHTLLVVAGLFAAAPSATAQVSFSSPVTLSAETRPQWTAVSDVDGDTDADLAISIDAPDQVALFQNDGAGVFTRGTSILLPGGSGPHAVVAEDLDGDGDDDLAVTLKNSNSVQLLINNGAGSFTASGSYATGTEPRDMVAGHLNAGTDLDLACVNRGSDQVTVLLGTGGAAFSASSFSVGPDPRGLALGRLDADADLDLAVSSHDDRTIEIYTNDGSGGFTLATTLSTPGVRPGFVLTADLDKDGDREVLTVADNFVLVFTNNGALSFSGPTSYTVGTNPSALACGDFDVEGDLDLACSNEDSNSVSLLQNLGSGTFAVASPTTVGTAPQHIVAGDLDGNGSLDLVTANRDSGNLSVLFNDNDGSKIAKATVRNGTGVNATCFSNLTLPVLGTSWDTSIDHSGHPGATLTIIVVKSAATTGPVLSFGEVLVTGPRLFRDTVSSSGTADLHSIPLPNDPKFAGSKVATQGVILGGGPELCNAIDLVIGF